MCEAAEGIPPLPYPRDQPVSDPCCILSTSWQFVLQQLALKADSNRQHDGAHSRGNQRPEQVPRDASVQGVARRYHLLDSSRTEDGLKVRSASLRMLAR
jgi:hypothetical protein